VLSLWEWAKNVHPSYMQIVIPLA